MIQGNVSLEKQTCVEWILEATLQMNYTADIRQ